jgi:hypothetical protein
MTVVLPISRVAVLAAHNIHSISGDPIVAYVAAMTAAAITGHMIDMTREQMHETLDRVFDVAMAKMLEATETKQ